ncbi:hypothetical protein C8Q73DRAFT_133664 [Cubamyces lactineus]|nr:hypothetical protein C8Q73DRAFT_133664 [Cubamyces lactineus]
MLIADYSHETGVLAPHTGIVGFDTQDESCWLLLLNCTAALKSRVRIHARESILSVLLGLCRRGVVEFTSSCPLVYASRRLPIRGLREIGVQGTRLLALATYFICPVPDAAWEEMSKLYLALANPDHIAVWVP